MKNLTWQNPEQLFVAQELINKVKSKCCGIKVQLISLDDVKRVKQQNLQNIIDARFNKKGKAQYSNQLKLEGFREEEMFAKLLLQTTEKMSLMDAALQLLPAEKMVHRLSELGYHGQLTPPPISL